MSTVSFRGVSTSNSAAGKKREMLLFLHHLSFLLRRLPAAQHDEYILELKEAVNKQRANSVSARVSAEDEALAEELHNQNLAYLRAMLDEIAGKALKTPNALEREIKCDRLVTGYCHLREGCERLFAQANQRSSEHKREEMVNLLLSNDLLAVPSMSEKHHSNHVSSVTLVVPDTTPSPAPAAPLPSDAKPVRSILKRAPSENFSRHSLRNNRLFFST